MENEHCSEAPNSSFFSTQQPTLKKSEHFIPNFDAAGIKERDDGLSVCAVENGENASKVGKTETANVCKTTDLDCQICCKESLKSENASAKENKTGPDLQGGQDSLLTLKKSEHFNPNFDGGILEKSDSLSVCVVEKGENASNNGETETTNVHKTDDLDCQICHEESLRSENDSAKENKTGHDVQCGQDLLSTLKRSMHFNPSFDEEITDRDDGLSTCAVADHGEKALTEGETETTHVEKTEDLDRQICHEESLNSENALPKENKTGNDVQRGQDFLLTLKKSEQLNPIFDEGMMERDDGPSICTVEYDEKASNEDETKTTNMHKAADLDRQMCHEESLRSENASAKANKTGPDLQGGQDLLLTLKKSEFNPNFDGGILERNDCLSFCVLENGENASNEGETETTNVRKTEDLDCQTGHEESLKSENAFAKENKTGHDVQGGQDLPLTADAALNNALNMCDVNFSIFGSNFVKTPIEEVDENVLYEGVNGKIIECLCLLNQYLLKPNCESVWEKNSLKLI